jgi:hypothetical protein
MTIILDSKKAFEALDKVTAAAKQVLTCKKENLKENLERLNKAQDEHNELCKTNYVEI